MVMDKFSMVMETLDMVMEMARTPLPAGFQQRFFALSIAFAPSKHGRFADI
jgi:hypothetical protein